jgi:hypothetical protein
MIKTACGKSTLKCNLLLTTHGRTGTQTQPYVMGIKKAVTTLFHKSQKSSHNPISWESRKQSQPYFIRVRKGVTTLFHNSQKSSHNPIFKLSQEKPESNHSYTYRVRNAVTTQFHMSLQLRKFSESSLATPGFWYLRSMLNEASSCVSTLEWFAIQARQRCISLCGVCMSLCMRKNCHIVVRNSAVVNRMVKLLDALSQG